MHTGTADASATAAEQKPWGQAGQGRRVQRTVTLVMDDRMRFTPERIEVRLGDTVRFELRNRGQLLHEMVMGTPAELDAHAALMQKFPAMAHDEPWMAHVRPGQTAPLVWHFNRAGQFQFACLIPGHYQAGMVGTLIVK
jgi:uncharacterized cupredoxin-like copper-binding protein